MLCSGKYLIIDIMMEKPKVSLFKQKIKEARQKREEEGMQV